MAFAFALVAPPSAFAHASLVGTTPTQGAVLDRSPRRSCCASTSRSRPSRARSACSTARCSASTRARSTKPSSDEVAVGLPDGLRRRHLHGRVAGALGRLAPDPRRVRVLGRRADRGRHGRRRRGARRRSRLGSRSTWSLAVVRFVGLALILLCVGGAAVLAFVADTRDARPRLLWIVLAAAAAVLAVDSLAWIALTGVKAAGFGLDAVFTMVAGPRRDRDGLRPGVARAGAARARARRARRSRRSDADRIDCSARSSSSASAIAVTPALSGHARVEGSLAILSDAIHVARGRRLGRRPRLPRSLARRGRRRPLVARHERRAPVLDARGRLGDRARRRRADERLPRGALLAGALAHDLRAAPARQGRAARCRCWRWERSTTGSPCPGCRSGAAGAASTAPLRRGPWHWSSR